MSVSVIALGSNMGDSVQILKDAINDLKEHCTVLKCSSFYRTKPVGYLQQDDFINAVVCAQTELGPYELLDFLHRTEARHNRVRVFRNGPRTLDLDIISYGDLVQDDARLTLPHTRMQERAFVLVPLHEIEPDMVIPGLNRSVSELYGQLERDSLDEVVKINA